MYVLTDKHRNTKFDDIFRVNCSTRIQILSYYDSLLIATISDVNL